LAAPARPGKQSRQRLLEKLRGDQFSGDFGAAISSLRADSRRAEPMSESAEDQFVMLYTTYPSLAEAERIGKAVLEQRLAACVNILPGMISHYWWQGAIERGEEVVMIIKTRSALAESVRATVKALHPYTVPAILVLPIKGGEPAYLDWLMAETEAR
jgi:periplasmic divalent cation tolerance protein